ncbi:adenylate/guanylate cyclase domain-containing protein [Pseudonocardia kujensis]|uniref:adenylate/guanylate cyclase domain-containing protein n=1 Tax=Pseudonocardia kujensis TaxID=1128675 RepID=UPI001E63D512|nr:adenylate/guanylate cyclase domain-containing protein [Pseudonocardia kujensis]MCE0763000.1 adenylate/guanylate cyclase domain-containing protein [Pseudonocardia kujensis]
MSEGWLEDLGSFLDAAARGERRRLAESAPLVGALEEMILGGPRRYTRAEVLERAGVPEEEGLRLWRSLGFPEVPDELVYFTDGDVDAAGLLATDPVARSLPTDVRETVLRAIAQSVSRLADWQVGMLARMVADRAAPTVGAASGEMEPEAALHFAADLLPTLERVQAYIWRRHMAAAVSRFVVGPLDDPESAETRALTVGFADMVGFTRTTRRRSPAELSEMIEHFEAGTTEVITECGGRLVKTVGDEVLFVTDEPAEAAWLALRLRERVRQEPSLPPLRIGLAAGDVLLRFGDVYGEPVNIAARLTTHARPDTVLVDRAVAHGIEGDERFGTRRLKPLQVRGYRHLQPYLLRERTHGT